MDIKLNYLWNIETDRSVLLYNIYYDLSIKKYDLVWSYTIYDTMGYDHGHFRVI
jgi:hypothetical protein